MQAVLAAHPNWARVNPVLVLAQAAASSPPALAPAGGDGESVSVPMPPAPAAPFSCPVCLGEDIPVSDVRRLRGCARHAVCVRCLRRHVLALMERGRLRPLPAAAPAPCPFSPGDEAPCGGVLTAFDCRSVLAAPEDGVYAARLEAALTGMRLYACPAAGCAAAGGAAVAPPGAGDVTCGRCGAGFCAAHGGAHATGGEAACARFEAERAAAERGAEDGGGGVATAARVDGGGDGGAAARALAVAGARRCPGCRAPTQRNGGCDHMSCRCGAHWCWSCGARVTVTPFAFHQCGALPRLPATLVRAAARQADGTWHDFPGLREMTLHITPIAASLSGARAAVWHVLALLLVAAVHTPLLLAFAALAVPAAALATLCRRRATSREAAAAALNAADVAARLPLYAVLVADSLAFILVAAALQLLLVLAGAPPLRGGVVFGGPLTLVLLPRVHGVLDALYRRDVLEPGAAAALLLGVRRPLAHLWYSLDIRDGLYVDDGVGLPINLTYWARDFIAWEVGIGVATGNVAAHVREAQARAVQQQLERQLERGRVRPIRFVRRLAIRPARGFRGLLPGLPRAVLR